MLIEVRGGARPVLFSAATPICFSPVQPLSLCLHAAAATSAAPPRAACRSIRLLCGSAVRMRAAAARCVVLVVCRSRGGGRGCKRSRGGLHFEAIEIATMEVKMLKEKVPNNIGWTSSADHQKDMLSSHPVNPTAGAHAGRFLAVSCRFERCQAVRRPSGHG